LPTILATQTSTQKQVLPTLTLASPTFTSVPEFAEVETEFQGNVSFQGTPVAFPNSQISPENAGKMSLIGQWGLGDLSGLTVSPDGKYIAVASSTGIFIFNSQSLEIEKQIDTGSWISAIAFSPDGKLLASGEKDGLIDIWDTTNWQEAQTPLSGHTQTVVDLAFSPDGTTLASVGKDNKLIRWTLEDPTKRLSVNLPATGAGAVAYSADNSQILTGGNDFKIQVWDASDLAPIKSATLSSKIVDIARVGNTGLFVVGSADQRINLLDLPNGLALQSIGSLQYPLTRVAASPMGDLVAAGDLNGGLKVWDKNGKQIWQSQNYVTTNLAPLELPGSPNNISFSPDGKILFSGLHDGTIRSLGASTGQEIKKDESFKGHVEKLAITDDGKYVIMQNDMQSITLWDLHNGKPLNSTQGEIEDGVPFSKDDSNLAIASDRSTVKVYKVPDLKEIYTLRGHQDIQTIEFIKNDAQLVAGYNRDMHLWSMSSGQELKIQRLFPGTGCNTITDLHGLTIFQITDYQFIVPTSQGNPSICAFQKLNWTTDIDREGNFIAYGGNSKLAVIDLRNRLSASIEMNANRKNVVRVAISPGGKLLAAAYDDNVIHLWDVASKQEITSLDGHTDLITDLVFTLDGKMLFSTSLDGTIRIWGVPN
jgi:WD40 repeat protein